MWCKVLALVVVVLVAVAAGALLFGTKRWNSNVSALHAAMDVATDVYDPRELGGLPAPVQRYLSTVLQEGQPVIAGVQVEHTGTLLTA